MELRNGMDLVEVDRIARAMETGPFLRRFFSPEEQAYFLLRKQAPQTVAANFAAKEAFAKAMGTGVPGFALREVAVLRDPLGRPYLSLSGRAAALGEGWRFAVSLTHTQTTAGAVVTAWKE